MTQTSIQIIIIGYKRIQEEEEKKITSFQKTDNSEENNKKEEGLKRPALDEIRKKKDDDDDEKNLNGGLFQHSLLCTRVSCHPSCHMPPLDDVASEFDRSNKM